MRILTWNINGIRTIPQYHPWNSMKNMEEILDHLQADIICFQEMKTTRAALEKSVAITPSYDSFFSFPVNKGGYSGVGIYTRRDTAVPLKAEHGLSGTLPIPKNLSYPGSIDRQSISISDAYPVASSMSLFPEFCDSGDLPQEPISLAHLDVEGRSLMLDFGLFVLINLYCPNETSDARLPFKMNYHFMVEERVKRLIQIERREVIVVGDMNVCAAPEDHCEGHLQIDAKSGLEEGSYMDSFVASHFKGRGFWYHPAREWFRRWIDKEDGMLVDVLRQRWPDRKGMYTCWNTKISARASNYGTRIDYILVSRGLLPWIKTADISPDIKGSDHCPVWVDFHDEIVSVAADGSQQLVKLVEAMRPKPPTEESSVTSVEPPFLASKWWNEFSGKQTLLSSFFSNKGSSMGSTQVPPELQSSVRVKASPASPESPSKPPHTPRDSRVNESGKRKLITRSLQITPDAIERSKKRKMAGTKTSGSQAKLSAFFGKPTNGSSALVAPRANSNGEGNDVDSTLLDADSPQDIQCQIEADYQYARSLSQSSSQGSITPNKGVKLAWTSIMAPVKPPKCQVHGEPTLEYTVNKPGPNKGKKFFICSRPVGPGYDKGRAERAREDVDPRWRCNFFKWSSEVKRDIDQQRTDR